MIRRSRKGKGVGRRSAEGTVAAEQSSHEHHNKQAKQTDLNKLLGQGLISCRYVHNMTHSLCHSRRAPINLTVVDRPAVLCSVFGPLCHFPLKSLLPFRDTRWTEKGIKRLGNATGGLARLFGTLCGFTAVHALRGHMTTERVRLALRGAGSSTAAATTLRPTLPLYVWLFVVSQMHTRAHTRTVMPLFTLDRAILCSGRQFVADLLLGMRIGSVMDT